MEPRSDLLSHREENEAYAMAEPGVQYAVYFTGHGDGLVQIDLSAASGNLIERAIDFHLCTLTGMTAWLRAPCGISGRFNWKAAYEPDLCLYENTPYKPLARPAPSELDKEIPQRMIVEARKRGMEAHIQIAPFFPPGLRAEDRPVYIDGAAGYQRFSNNACLNNPDAEAYALALVEDTVRHYPDVDGLFMDWVEFGAYRLEDHFTCFCPHCQSEAKKQGFDWSIVRRDAMVLWNWLHSLTPRELERSHRILHTPSEMLELFIHHPGLLQFLQFKAGTVSGFYRQARERLDAIEMKKIGLSARGWPPPWNRSSGMDYHSLIAIRAWPC